jgi:hypothetical protein
MQAKIKKLEQQAEALIAKQSSGVIEKIRKLMAEHGLTAADIEGHAGGKGRAKKVGAKTVSKGALSRSNIPTRRVARRGRDMAGHPNGLQAQKIAINSLLMEVRRRRRRHLRAKRRLLAITSAVRSLRFIVTQRMTRLGAGVGGRRRGLLKPKTEANF